MQCRSSPVGVWSTRSERKATKFSERVESQTQPEKVLMNVEGSEEAGGAMAAVLELLTSRLAGYGRTGRVDPGFGLDTGLLVHAPHDGVLRWVEITCASPR